MSYDPNSPRERTFEDRAGDRPQPSSSDLGGMASGVKRKVADTADQSRAAAADTMDTASSALDASGRRTARAAETAADALATSADYIREHDLSAMADDVLQVVKKNPGPALLGAAALGFLIGRAFSRS